MKTYQRSRAFSLVEVTLAIGIVAFALLTVVALLPVGAKTTRDSEDQARATQIMNAIATAIQEATADHPTDKGGTVTRYWPLAPYGMPNKPAAIGAAANNDSASQPANGLPWWGHYESNGTNYPSNVPTRTCFYIGENGLIVTSATAARYFAAVSINPPRDRAGTGIAYIGVAWPGMTSWLNSNNLLSTTTAPNAGAAWTAVPWVTESDQTAWPTAMSKSPGTKIYVANFATKPLGSNNIIGFATNSSNLRPSYVETIIYFHPNDTLVTAPQ